jgi:hypothetical protein
MKRRDVLKGLAAGTLASAVGPPSVSADGTCTVLENDDTVANRGEFTFLDGSPMGVASIVDHLSAIEIPQPGITSPPLKIVTTADGHTSFDYATAGIDYGADELVILVTDDVIAPSTGSEGERLPGAGELAGAVAEQLREAQIPVDYTDPGTEFVAFSASQSGGVEFLSTNYPAQYYKQQMVKGWKLAQFIRDYACRSCVGGGDPPEVRIVAAGNGYAGGEGRTVTGALGALDDVYGMQISSVDLFNSTLPEKLVAFHDGEGFFDRNDVGQLISSAIDLAEGTELGETPTGRPILRIGDLDFGFGNNEPVDTTSRAWLLSRQVEDVRFWYHSDLPDGGFVIGDTEFPATLASGYHLSEGHPANVNFFDVKDDYGRLDQRSCGLLGNKNTYPGSAVSGCVSLGDAYLGTDPVVDLLTYRWENDALVTPRNSEQYESSVSDAGETDEYSYTVRYDAVSELRIELNDADADDYCRPAGQEDCQAQPDDEHPLFDVGVTSEDGDERRYKRGTDVNSVLVLDGGSLRNGERLDISVVVSDDWSGGTVDYGLDIRETGVERRKFYTTCPSGDNPSGALPGAKSVSGGGSDGDSPPVAQISAPTSATVGELVSFDGSGSSDPDGDIDTYEWTIDGTDVTLTGPQAGNTFGSTGTYTVRLTVTDTNGNQDTASQTLDVTDGTGTNTSTPTETPTETPTPTPSGTSSTTTSSRSPPVQYTLD